MLTNEDFYQIKLAFLNKKHCSNLKQYAYFKKTLYEAAPEARNLIKSKLKSLEEEIAVYYEICKKRLNE